MTCPRLVLYLRREVLGASRGVQEPEVQYETVTLVKGHMSEDFADDASANRPTAFSDCESETRLHRYGREQLERRAHVVAWHHHLGPFRKRDCACKRAQHAFSNKGGLDSAPSKDGQARSTFCSYPSP